MNSYFRPNDITCNAADFRAAEAAVIKGAEKALDSNDAENTVNANRKSIAGAIQLLAKRYKLEPNNPNLGELILENMKNDPDEIIQAVAFKIENILLKDQNITLKKELSDCEKKTLDKHAMDAIKAFATDLMHHLRSKLAVVVGNSDLMAETFKKTEHGLSNEDILDMVEDIQISANAIKKLLERLSLFMSRGIEKWGWITLDELIDNGLNKGKSLAEELIGKDRMLVETTFHHDDGGDLKVPAIMQEALDELIINAVEAKARIASSDKVAELKLTISCGRNDEGDFKITVRDTGAGIPKTFIATVSGKQVGRDDVFGLFNTTKQPNDPAGLGLCIVKTIIDNLGGRVDFETYTVDEIAADPQLAGKKPGTAFRITLPASSLGG